jgi:hypothetical protein
MKNKYLATSVAIAAMLGAAASMRANGIAVTNSQLVLGFQDGSNSITFDVGSVAPILDALNGVTTDLGFNVNSALSYTSGGSTTLGNATGYGSTWASSGSVVWGVAAKDTAAATPYQFVTGFVDSSLSTTLGVGPAVANSTPIAIGDAGAPGSSMGTLINAMGTAPKTALLTAGSPTNILAVKYINSSGNSWNHIDPNSAAAAFGGMVPSAQMNTNTTATVTGTAGLLNGLSYSALDLYGYENNGASVDTTFLGTLELTTGGELFFTSAVSAIPEPSTYAMILGVAALGFVMIRRRQQVAA